MFPQYKDHLFLILTNSSQAIKDEFWDRLEKRIKFKNALQCTKIDLFVNYTWLLSPYNNVVGKFKSLIWKVKTYKIMNKFFEQTIQRRN